MRVKVQDIEIKHDRVTFWLLITPVIGRSAKHPFVLSRQMCEIMLRQMKEAGS